MKVSTEKHAFWSKHLEAWKSSGLTQEAYCVEAGVTYSSFKRWRSHLREGARTNKVPRFVEAMPVEPERTPNNALILQISLANGARITVSAHASLEIVQQALTLAGGTSCSA